MKPEKLEKIRKDWNAIKLRNPAVGDYIDFNNFLNFCEKYDQEKREFFIQISEKAVMKEVSRNDTAYLFQSVSVEVGRNILERIKKLIESYES